MILGCIKHTAVYCTPFFQKRQCTNSSFLKYILKECAPLYKGTASTVIRKKNEFPKFPKNDENEVIFLKECTQLYKGTASTVIRKKNEFPQFPKNDENEVIFLKECAPLYKGTASAVIRKKNEFSSFFRFFQGRDNQTPSCQP